MEGAEVKEFNLLSFAAHLARLPALVLIEQHEGLERAARVVERAAKAKMGEYQAGAGPFVGWAELRDSTKEERVEQGYPENEPELRSGLLRDSIEHHAEEFEAQIGVPDKMVQHPYHPKPENIGDIAVYQELGTDKMPPRSFLGGAGVESAHEVVEILGSGVVAALVGEQVFKKRIPVL